VGHSFGFEKVLPEEQRKRVVSVIGDSTFLHSGVTSLMDIAYNGGRCTVIILDNRTTAMTGRQEHPGTGKNIRGEQAGRVDLPALCRSLGVEDVRVTQAWQLDGLEAQIKAALEHEGPSVIINEGGCVLLDRSRVLPMRVDEELCQVCGMCVETGCPAITEEDGEVTIDPLRCRACGVCAQVCPFDAIGPTES
jgi:indolepyruvate ferredoxin oxidoreductase alpha subunit